MANESFISQMTENPEYQKMVMRLMQTPPAIRAIANIGPAEEAFATDMLKKDLTLRKLGQSRKEAEDKLALGYAKLDNEKFGLGTSQAYYGLKLQNANNAVDLAKHKQIGSNILGALNLGTSIYGAVNTRGLQEQLLNLHVNRLLGV